MTRTSFSVVLTTWTLSLAACSSGGDTIEFEAELSLLPGFEKDTGFQPADQPAQVRVVALASGTVKARAEATGENGALEPVAGSGQIEVAGAMAFEVHAKIDTAGIAWEGMVHSFALDIPEASADFDPFLLDGEAMVTNTIPAQEVTSVPLPSVPGGNLVLTIEGGSLQTSFSGTCASASGDMAQYTGTTATTGTIQLGATITAEVPIAGTQTFGPFTVTVDIPAIESDLDMGTHDMSGAKVDGVGPCSGGGAGGGGGGADDPDEHGTGGGGGTESCPFPTDLGDLTSFSGPYLGSNGTDVGFRRVVAGVPGGELMVLLTPGFGGFDGQPGVYPIAGDNGYYPSCGACVSLLYDYNRETGTVAQFLMAQSGTVTVVEMNPTEGLGGHLLGTLTDVVLRQVTFDDNFQQLEVPDGCYSRINSLTFDVTTQ